MTSFDAKKCLPPLETWQILDQDITVAASTKGSFDYHESAEKGPEATTYSGLARQRYECPPLFRLSCALGLRVVRAYLAYQRGSPCSILGR